MELYREDNAIRTYTGKYINIFNPSIEDIDILDIAHSLSQQCRFSGHTKSFVSIAQHSINCAALVPQEYKLVALLHDASEAYMLDVPTPIKKAFHGYREIEDNMMKLIAYKFGFEYPLPQVVKDADKCLLWLEWREHMLGCEVEANDSVIMCPWDSKTAKAIFLNEFEELSNDRT